MAVINGTEGDDVLNGTAGDDTINGLGGNDIINGGDGADWIDGGDGDDYINPGGGVGTSGEVDVIVGSFGSDIIDYSQSAPGQYLIYGYVDLGSDFIIDVDRNQFSVENASFSDTIIEIQSLVRNFGFIFIGGTALNDRFYINYSGDGGAVVIQPGDGKDVFYLNDNSEEAQGDVRLSFTFDTVGVLVETGVHIDLSLSSGQIIDDGFGNTESIYGDGYFTEFELTFADDVFVGGEADEEIDAYSGADIIDGGGGADLIDFRAADYEGIVVNLDEGWASGQIVGPYGTKDLNYTLMNVEDVDGSSDSADDITGSSAANVLRGFGGNDTLRGLGGNDTLIGGEGDDFLCGGSGDDILTGGVGGDVFHFELPVGNDVVTDFDASEDVIAFSVPLQYQQPSFIFGITNQVGNDVVASAWGHTITLEGVQLADLSLENLAFA